MRVGEAGWFDVRRFDSALRGERLGRKIIVLDETDSTNRTAKELDEAGAPDGTVIVAETQRAGRGRFGRAWASPRGGLWFSLVLRPGADDPAVPLIPLIAGLSLVGVLEEAAGEVLALGWPNDVVCRGKKLAGILVEGVFERGALVVVGVGVNVNNSAAALPVETAGTAVSLLDVTGREHSREALLAEFIVAFEERLDAARRGGAETLLREWKERLRLTGEAVTLKMDEAVYRGVVEGFTLDGGMALRLADGTLIEVPLDRGTLVSSKYAKRL